MKPTPYPHQICLKPDYHFSMKVDIESLSYTFPNAEKARAWCGQNCQGKYEIDANFETIVYFELSEDAALFMLFWE